MNINYVDYTNMNGYLGVALASGSIGGVNGAETAKESFQNVFGSHLLNKKPTLVGEIAMIREEKRIIMNQFLESFRLENEARRIDLTNKQVRKEEEAFDSLTESLDIAMRIMRADKVADEEARLLTEQFPKLFLMSLLLKDDNIDEAEREEFIENFKLAAGLSSSKSGVEGTQMPNINIVI